MNRTGYNGRNPEAKRDPIEEARALREQEEAEEREYAREYHGADALPGIDGVKVGYPAKMVREWVRSVLLPPAIKRLYDIGMGVQTFDQPTAAGNVVTIEAPPMVQTQALKTLVAIGVPTQMGIVDGDDNTLPGVLALGTLELDAARAESHGDRYVSPESHARLVAAVQNGDPAATVREDESDGDGHAPKPMSDRIAAGEFTVVEIEEGIGAPTEHAQSDDVPPGPIVHAETPAQLALRRHRERMKAKRPPGWQNTHPTPPQTPEE